MTGSVHLFFMAIDGCLVSVLSVLDKPSPLSSPPPGLFKVQLYLQPFLLFLSLLSLAHSQPSSDLSSAARSSQSYPLPDHQEEPSIAVYKPFIFETVAASYRAAGGLLTHPDFALKEQASSLDDEQDHASIKEEPPVATPAFIHEEVAASFSSKLTDAPMTDSHAHPQFDHGANHVPFIVKQSFIYEAVAASLARKAIGGAGLRHENAPQSVKEHTIPLLDEAASKPIRKRRKVSAEPSFIYESVIEGMSIHSTPSSDGGLLLDNVPQEENAFLLDDGSPNSIMQKKKDTPTTSRPLFIYESIAASMRPEVHDTIHTDAKSQEENAFLLDDGSKHADNSKKEIKPLAAKTCIHESVVCSSDRLHENSSKETSSVLDDDGKHIVQSGLNREGVIKGRLSIGNAHTTTSSHLGVPPARADAPHQDNILLLDVHQSQCAVALASTQDGKLLRDKVPQGRYAFLRGDGCKKSMSDAHGHDGKTDWLIDTGPKEVRSQSLHYDDVQNSLNVQESKSPAPTLVRHNVPQGKHAILVGDGGNVHIIKQDSGVPSLKDVEVSLHANVPQEKHGSLVDDGGEHLGKSTQKAAATSDMSQGIHLNAVNPRLVMVGDSHEANLRMVVGAPPNRMVHRGVGDNPHQNKKDPRNTHEGAVAERYPTNEENIKTVVGDESSNKQIKTGYKARGNPSSEGSLRMVVPDSSKSLVQEGFTSNPPKENNSRRGVDVLWTKSMKKDPIGMRNGRSRSCTSNPDVCKKLAYAESINHIALYGQPLKLTQQNKTACCSGICVDLNDNHLSCGSCGKTCGLAQTCCNGKCTDLNTDGFNCGECGHVCPSQSPCQYGMCGYY